MSTQHDHAGFAPVGVGGTPPPDLSAALCFYESEFLSAVASPSRCGSACAPEGAALTRGSCSGRSPTQPPAATSVLGLKGISEMKCL